MFNKAQMKLFGMIVSILLAVFIALIIGINFITEAVMSQESKEVLQNIAANLGYNEEKNEFYLDTRDNPNGGRTNNPPPKPADDKKETSSPSTASASSGTAPTSTETTAENTDAATEGEENTSGDNSENNTSEPDNEPQQTEPKTEDFTWFAIPTSPSGFTVPNSGGQSWSDWNKGDNSSQGGQNWGGGFGFGGSGTQDWSQWNNQGGNQDWSQWNGGQDFSQWTEEDWKKWYEQYGNQNWGQWNEQEWKKMYEQYWSQFNNQNNGQNWNNQDWNNQNNNQDWNLNGWKWDGTKWVNDDGSTWDGQGTPPWFTQPQGKNENWWGSANPYTWWMPNNPMNPMNPDNQYAKKFNEYDNCMNSKVKSGASDEEEPETDSEISDAVLTQTAYDSGDYQIVQLGFYGESYAPYSDKSSSTARNKASVELIPKTIDSIDYFAIMADTNGKYLATLYNDYIIDERAQRYTSAIINDRKDTGMINSYQYYRASKPNGTIMILTDKSSEKDMLNQLKRTTIIVGLIALVVLSVLAYFLSKKSIQPIREAFDKQKQFVSDASHELKTPLTVISTNADVLEGEIGENKWLAYIKSQTDRMSVLVNDLLNLTRLENSNNELERRYFNLSKAIANTALPFECQAFESNKKFEVNIEDNIMLSGSEKHIKQMAAIFIDNALKYSNDGGTIQVTLKRSGERKLFSVYNTGQGIKEADTDKIFERFYRSDESRNRATGGYGLGLAIAKSVADKHKFKIHVLNQPGKSVCFIVTM
jgi:signal transduction histidine kinase